jgi:hypothetical protein
MGFEPRQGAFLVFAHQPAVARDIGRKDRRQSALDPPAIYSAILASKSQRIISGRINQRVPGIVASIPGYFPVSRFGSRFGGDKIPGS